MRIRPDQREAAQEQDGVGRLVRAALVRAFPSLSSDDAFPAQEERHPAVIAVAHAAQRWRRSPSAAPEQERELLDRFWEAAARADRAEHRSCPRWQVELARPGTHLRESLARALSQIPEPLRANKRNGPTVVAGWLDEERARFCAAACLLDRAWPEMLDELRVTVRQVALLDGDAVDGFTDFTIHGAVLINRRRLVDSASGLPGPVRFAEALVHEGTHNRCNAAAVREPFLRPATAGAQAVMTPLRPDPRPLTGLFQQLVVLVRCVLLYERLLGGGMDGEAAVRAQHETLLDQAHQARETLDRHHDQLTDSGRAILAEASALVTRQSARARVAGP